MEYEEKHRPKNEVKKQTFHVLERNKQMLSNWREIKYQKLEEWVNKLLIIYIKFRNN